MKVSAIRIVAIGALCVIGTVQAQVTAKDKEQLAAVLRTGTPCCVIDGRSAASRKQRPLADALVYRPDSRIKPTAAVVVIADRDVDAIKIAEALAQKHPGKQIIAVKGGINTWQDASRAAALLAMGIRTPGGNALSFIIPSNTCEQGKPLQELRSGAQ
ncbi:MAG: hypothetical protein D4S02_16790 [Rhodocyclaceae bacterium]|nr:MAG: hypothetical protein D4S02_16790 [Rhodocyclaceae bacterium]